MSGNVMFSQPGDKISGKQFMDIEDQIFERATGVSVREEGSNSPSITNTAPANQGSYAQPNSQPSAMENRLKTLESHVINSGAYDKDVERFLTKPIQSEGGVQQTPAVSQTVVPGQTNTQVQSTPQTQTSQNPFEDLMKDFGQGESNPAPAATPNTATTQPVTPNPSTTATTPSSAEYIQKYNTVIENKNNFLKGINRMHISNGRSDIPIEKVIQTLDGITQEELYGFAMQKLSNGQSQTNQVNVQQPQQPVAQPQQKLVWGQPSTQPQQHRPMSHSSIVGDVTTSPTELVTRPDDFYSPANEPQI